MGDDIIQSMDICSLTTSIPQEAPDLPCVQLENVPEDRPTTLGRPTHGRGDSNAHSTDEAKAYDLQAPSNKYKHNMKRAPREHRHASHPHLLRKMKKCYYASGIYGCDICHEFGNGWVYHCEQCGSDFHPCCVGIQA